MEAPSSLFSVFSQVSGVMHADSSHATQTHARWEAEGADGLSNVPQEAKEVYVLCGMTRG